MRPALPEGAAVELPGRGLTVIHRVAGPPGAPVLVLLHGLAVTSALNWGTSFAPLGALFDVVSLDQRGHGRGIRRWGAHFLEECADDVAALAKVLAVERLVVVGYSWGGLVAQLVWRRHPELVAGLVLCSTDRGFTGSSRERRLRAGMPGVAAAMQLTPPWFRPGADVVGRALMGQIDDVGIREWVRAEMRRSSLAAVAAAASGAAWFDSRPWIGDVDVPVAVVITRRDRVVPSSRQFGLARAIRGATVHVVEADHMAFVTHPRRFVPRLLEACRSVVRRVGRSAGHPAPTPSFPPSVPRRTRATHAGEAPPVVEEEAPPDQ